jgi:pyruvate/2-oxoglutarate/acetoin dehydrogenase E1 component
MALKELSYSEAAVLAIQREMEADARVVVLGEDVGRGGIFGQYKGLQQPLVKNA